MELTLQTMMEENIHKISPENVEKEQEEWFEYENKISNGSSALLALELKMRKELNWEEEGTLERRKKEELFNQWCWDG